MIQIPLWEVNSISAGHKFPFMPFMEHIIWILSLQEATVSYLEFSSSFNLLIWIGHVYIFIEYVIIVKVTLSQTCLPCMKYIFLTYMAGLVEKFWLGLSPVTLVIKYIVLYVYQDQFFSKF